MDGAAGGRLRIVDDGSIRRAFPSHDGATHDGATTSRLRYRRRDSHRISEPLTGLRRPLTAPDKNALFARMFVLAIDTALEACSAAAVDTERGLLASESHTMARGHAESLMPLIARVMDKANLPFMQLDRIAVTTGPGSFTGLRVGVSAARGIALASAKPAVGITTLAAFAAPYLAVDDEGAVASVVDARHGNVYLQIFGPGSRTLVMPRIAPMRDAIRLIAQESARVVGSAAHVVRDAWPAHIVSPTAINHHVAPDITWVARLGATAREPLAPVTPAYLRPPDAHPQTAARLPRR